MAEDKREPKPTVMYRDGESRTFDHPDDVPKGEGWVDHPDKVKRKDKKLPPAPSDEKH